MFIDINPNLGPNLEKKLSLLHVKPIKQNFTKKTTDLKKKTNKL